MVLLFPCYFIRITTWCQNRPHCWKLWRKHFGFYVTATEKDRKNGQVKTSVLLTCTRQKGREIYETLNFDNPGGEIKLEAL